MKKIQGSCLLHHMDLHVTVKLLHKYEVHSALKRFKIYTSFKNIPNFYFFSLTFSLKLNYEGVGTFFSVSIYKNWSKINIKEVLAYKYWYCVTPGMCERAKNTTAFLLRNRDKTGTMVRSQIEYSSYDPLSGTHTQRIILTK